MIPGRQYTWQDWMALAWGRKWSILVPLAVATTATIAVASRLPDRYRAEALIQASSQNVSAEFVRNTVATTQTMRDRLPWISQQMFSRTRLERIVQELGLTGKVHRPSPRQALVDDVRRSLGFSVNPVRATAVDTVVADLRDNAEVTIGRGAETFVIAYVADDPLVAMQVTEKFAAHFIEESALDREGLARATSDFLGTQLEDARAQLVTQEKRLEIYRLEHGPELPSQLSTNMQQIQSAQVEMQNLNEAINRDRDRRLLVARQLADLQSEEFLGEAGAIGLSVLQGSSIMAKLDSARADLTALELRLTPEHPDVAQARRAVADLEAKARQEAALDSSADTRRAPISPAEIAKRNRVKELRLEMESLDRQVAIKLADVAKLRETVETYQSRIGAVPKRESELAALTRDYEMTQTMYKNLLWKKGESRVAENLEKGQVGQQFKILDPPRVPVKPFTPNRLKLDAWGALAGLGFGILLAGLLEYLDPRVKGEADVRAALDVPVVALIPQMMDRVDRRRRRWRQLSRAFALITVFATCAAVVSLTFRI